MRPAEIWRALLGILEGIGTIDIRIAIGEEILFVPNVRLTEGEVRV
jgi:hypothetical protein